MALAALIFSIMMQIGFAVMQMAGVAMMGGGSDKELPKLTSFLVEASGFVFPLISISVCIALVIMYRNDSAYYSLWWHALPPALFIPYLFALERILH